MKKITKKSYSNSMKVLNFMCLNRRTVYGGETYCSFSQEEMAEILSISRGKVQRSICVLSELGYVEKVPQKCRKYTVTESGREALRRLKK